MGRRRPSEMSWLALVAPGSSVSARSSARRASASSRTRAEQLVELDPDQRVALVARHRAQPLPGRFVGIVGDDAEDGLRSGPAVTDGSLAAKRRLASATHRRIAERAERADQLVAQHRVVGRLVGARRPAEPAHAPGRASPAAKRASIAWCAGSSSYMPLIWARMSAIRISRRRLALAGAAADQIERGRRRLVAGEAERPIVGEQADLVERAQPRIIAGEAGEQSRRVERPVIAGLAVIDDQRAAARHVRLRRAALDQGAQLARRRPRR